MAGQTSKNILLAKMGAGRLQKAHSKVKDNPVEMGNNSQLPAGIENGIAELVDIKIGTYKEGDKKGLPFFMAAGVVKLPLKHDGIPVAGLRTQIGPHVLADFKAGKRTTFEEHYDWMLNELKKLGISGEDVDPTDLDSLFQAMKESSPPITFRFRTWKGKKATEGPYKDKEPQTQHDWCGVCEYEEATETSSEDVDETEEGGEEEEVDPEPVKESPKGKGKGGKTVSTPTKSKNKEEKQEEEEPAEEEFDEFGDLDSLAEKADNKDKAAAKKLIEFAKKAGVSEEDIEAAEDFSEVVVLITNAKESEEGGDAEEGEAEEGEEEAAQESSQPAVDDIMEYFPIKNGKPSKIGVSVEITAVQKKTETVTLKELESGKIHKLVPWDALKPA